MTTVKGLRLRELSRTQRVEHLRTFEENPMRRTATSVVAVALLAVLLITAAVAVAGGGAACRARGLASLRAEGPAGLQRILDQYADVLAKGPRPNDASWRRAADDIDTVAAQRDAWA